MKRQKSTLINPIIKPIIPGRAQESEFLRTLWGKF
jgi:hypothetical protein